MSQLAPVFVLATFVALFGCALIYVASLCGAKGRETKHKREGYECGLEVSHAATSKVPIKFYLTAILFILFDIEIIFMYPWALSYGEFIESGYGIFVFSVMAIFLLVFVFGLFWEIKSKALEWE